MPEERRKYDVNMERWRGKVDEQLENLGRDMGDAKRTLEHLDAMLRAALDLKADKAEVTAIHRLVVGIIISVAGFSIATLVGIIVWSIQCIVVT